MYGDEVSAIDQNKTDDYFVDLRSVGNPDLGQNPIATLVGVKNDKLSVSSLKEAIAVCREYIVNNELGGGNWAGGEVTKEGVVVALVSYNCRVWYPT